MNENRSDKALALLAQLSYIDDEHIAYADQYFVKRRNSHAPIIASLSVAATVFITVTLILNVFLSSFFTGKPNLDSEVQAPQESHLSPVQTVLYASKSEQSMQVYTFTPCIVWQDEGQTEYNIITVEEDDIKRLVSRISSGTKANSDTEEKTKVWLCPGNGTVISPYLKHSSGNVGIEIFDYEPELIPSASFTNELERIINERN